MKVATVIGHHENQKGAMSPYFGLREWDFYNEVVQHVENIDVFHYNKNISGFVSRIKDTARKLDDYDLVIEMHFNAFFNPNANGCETLYYYESQWGKYYAELFSYLVNGYTDIKLRNGGLKALVNRHDRGWANVFYPKPPTILIEPFFGSSPSDCEKIISTENLGCIINEFISQISADTDFLT